MINPARWQLSNDPRITPAEAFRLLEPSKLTVKEKEELKGRFFVPGGTMGTDPEFFVSKEVAPKKFDLIPAFNVLADKKVNPYVFWDGFQAECTVRPRNCHQELASEIAYSLSRLPSSLQIVPSPIWRVPKHFLANAAEEHVRLGCDPSYNVHNMKGRPVPDGRELLVRFAGGHIHFSLYNPYKNPPRVKSIVRACDAILAVPCVAFAAGVDHPIRRQYYGLPGEFRLPEHGLEYRTLSNFWLYHPQAYHLVFDLARMAHNIGKGGLNRVFVGKMDDVINIVRYSDVRSARDMVKLNAGLYDTWLGMSYPPAARNAFWAAIENGFLKTIPGYGENIRQAWGAVSSEFVQPMWKQMGKVKTR